MHRSSGIYEAKRTKLSETNRIWNRETAKSVAISIQVNLLRREEINLSVTKFSLLVFAVERLAFIRLKLGYKEMSNFYLYVYALSRSV